MSASLRLHQLEFADRLAELLALVQIRHDHVHAGVHDAERAGRQHDALVIKPRHQDVHAAAKGTKNVLLRDLAVLEDKLAGVGAAHAELVELRADRKPVKPLLDEEGRDAA